MQMQAAWRATGPWSLAAAFYALLHAGLLLFGSGDIVRLLTIIAFLPYNAVMLLLSWRLLRHYAAVRPAGRAFQFLLLSFVANVTGSLGWIHLENFAGADPEFSWVNVPYMLSYLFTILCVRGVTAGLQPQSDRRGYLLDNVMLIAGIGILVWYMIVVPLIELSHDRFETLIIIGYPFLEFCVLVALLPLILRSTTARMPAGVRLFAAGWTLNMIADFTFQLTTELSQPVLGLTPLAWNDIVYCLSYLTLIASAESLLRLAPEQKWSPPATQAPAYYWSPVPLLVTGIVYLVLLLIGAQRGMEHYGDIALAWILMTGLVVLSEVLSTRQHARLLQLHSAQEADARFWAIVRDLDVGIVLYGPDTLVQTCNPRALQMLDLREDEFVGRIARHQTWDVLREDDTPCPPAEFPLYRAIETGLPVRNAILGLLPRHGGQRVWMLVNADPKFDAGGQLQSVIMTMVDISDRLLLERQLRQSQRMESIGQLAGGIAHNFNNLLTVIIGYADLLRAQLLRQELRTEYADQILSASQRTAELTAQLLAFGRRQMLQTAVLDVNAVTADLGQMLAPLLGAEIEVRIELAPQALHVRADRAQLEQVILNMALNARDAMPDGGTLTLQTGLSPGAGPQHVMITIVDTGTGMTPDVVERVFEPFFTTREVSAGGGLGLSVAYGMVKQSGGEIEVDSIPGKGSTFRILLPRVPSPAAD